VSSNKQCFEDGRKLGVNYQVASCDIYCACIYKSPSHPNFLFDLWKP